MRGVNQCFPPRKALLSEEENSLLSFACVSFSSDAAGGRFLEMKKEVWAVSK